MIKKVENLEVKNMDGYGEPRDEESEENNAKENLKKEKEHKKDKNPKKKKRLKCFSERRSPSYNKDILTHCDADWSLSSLPSQ